MYIKFFASKFFRRSSMFKFSSVQGGFYLWELEKLDYIQKFSFRKNCNVSFATWHIYYICTNIKKKNITPKTLNFFSKPMYKIS